MPARPAYPLSGILINIPQMRYFELEYLANTVRPLTGHLGCRAYEQLYGTLIRGTSR